MVAKSRKVCFRVFRGRICFLRFLYNAESCFWMKYLPGGLALKIRNFFVHAYASYFP